MNSSSKLESIEVGVVGLGLMGSSIVVALLLAGHKVNAIAPIPGELESGAASIREQLQRCRQSGFLQPGHEVKDDRLHLSEDYHLLKNCRIVLECVIEDMAIKAKVYKCITDVVSEQTIIATNTSAITITALQQLVVNPARFLGVHWAEPAYATRFMEITCGAATDVKHAEWIFNVAHYWGKEPTLLRKDIQGFITNRLMYAVYREIFHLIDTGRATKEDVDKAFRYDAGSWITLMGVFRRMDFVGLKDSAAILKNILPTLSNEDKVPQVMQAMVDTKARGVHNLKGLYPYTAASARKWEDAYAAFNKSIFQLASSYPSRITDVPAAPDPAI